MGTQPSSRYDLSGASIGIGRVVDQSVTVHSDPEPNPAIGDPYGAPIHADNFEHVGSDKAATWFPNGDNSQTGVPIESFPNYRHRGGVLWQGYGCDGSFANAFPTLDWTRSKCGSSPTPSPRALHLSYGAQSVFTSGTYRYQEDILPLTYNRTDINRGWIKIEYSGTQSASKVPYCMRTKAISIGTWKAGERNADGVPRYPSIEIPLSNLGISADRISKMTAALISDKGYYCEGCVEGTTVNDFSAPSSISGMNHAQVGDAENMSGGDFYIDGKRNRMILQWHRASTVGMGLFGRYNFTGPDNRGFIRVDYLAGNCEEGLANFSVKTIPSPNTGACTGTSSTTVPIHIEGSGAGLATGATADEVTYVYHTLSASNKTVEVKINNQDALTDRYGIAGIMIRSSLNANATHVSAVVASKYNSSTSGRITACGRLTTGGGNETFSTNGQAPVWLRIQKLGGAFYVKYSYNHSTWTNLYSYGVGNFPSTYYVGFIVANSTNPRLSKPEFQYFAEL
jgi:regulation of enolase protein 1 (concanavalin A-like superfamily)